MRMFADYVDEAANDNYNRSYYCGIKLNWYYFDVTVVADLCLDGS